MASINDSNRANDWSVGGIKRRDFRADHGSGPEELPMRGKRTKAKAPKKPGCPENGGRAHIYVWIEFRSRYKQYKHLDNGMYDTSTFRMIDETWWEQTCIGCGKRNNRKWAWGGRQPAIEVYEVRNVSQSWWRTA